VEQKLVAIARQQRSKHVSMAMNQHVTVKELLEVMFSEWSTPWLYNEDQQQPVISSACE
jgi:hypothetical protein